jgi:hypothetical protein
MSSRLERDEVLRSSVSDATFLVIEPGSADSMPTMNAVAMFKGRLRSCSTTADPATDCDLRGGERYVDVVTGLTLLCVWPGRGVLCYEGRRLTSQQGSLEQTSPSAPARPSRSRSDVGVREPVRRPYRP